VAAGTAGVAGIAAAGTEVAEVVDTEDRVGSLLDFLAVGGTGLIAHMVEYSVITVPT
jgi:hypothetical protein